MQNPPVPPLDIVDHAGRRRRVELGSEADTVGDLARALGHRDGWATIIDGHTVPAGRCLTSVHELLEGAQVGFDERLPDPAGTDGNTTAIDVGLQFAVVTGPSCRTWTPLPVGRHGLGRSPAATIRLSDELAEVHHALIDVDRAGSVTLTQLTGRVPVLVVRPPNRSVVGSIGGEAALTRPVDRSDRLEPGDVLVIGSTRVELRSAPPVPVASGHGHGTLAEVPDDPWHLEVRRGPDHDHAPVHELQAPAPEAHLAMPAGTALVGAIVAFLGALAIAGLLRQTMFAVFALVGAVGAGATWAVGALSVVRRRRVARRVAVLDRQRFATDLQAWRCAMIRHHTASHAEIVNLLAELGGDRSRVWSRRPLRHEPIDVVIGRGAHRLEPVLDGDHPRSADLLALLDDRSLLHDVAVPIRLERAQAVAICGEAERVRSLVRSMIVQLATRIGPADLHIVVVGDHLEWGWVQWLPHARIAGGSVMVVGPCDVDRSSGLMADVDHVDGPTTLLIVDDPALLTSRAGPLRRFMTRTGATTVVAVHSTASVPTVCRRSLTLSPHGGAQWSGGPATVPIVDVAIAGLDRPTAVVAARALAPLVDPELGDHTQARLPDHLTFDALDTVTGSSGLDDVVARWSATDPDPALRAPIGVSSNGIVEIDLVADGPHALVAGTTGSGKSELLRTLVVSMACRVSPTHLNFVLVDYKGGSTFDSCARLPHTVGLVTDLDEGLAQRALVSLDAELTRRERLLRAVRAADLTEYRRCSGAEGIARLVVVVDEFATLAHELPDFMTALVAIAQRGRSLGVHVVLATQRPAGVVTDDIRANTDLRIALRVTDASEARDVVGDALPASFPKSVPGRAMVRLGPDDWVTFQAARCTSPVPPPGRRLRVTDPEQADSPARCERLADAATLLASAVDVVGRAAEQMALPPARRPWLEPLPAVVYPAMVDAVVHAQTTRARPNDPAGAAPHDAVGIVDDPAQQRRTPLRWDHVAGNLLIVGTLGAGRTSTVVSLTAALCRTVPPERCHVYVIDALGDRTLDGLVSVAHVGGVIRVGEGERIDRLLRRLTDDIDQRSAMVDGATTLPRTVLFVDGFGELRRSLEPVERLATLAMLERVLDAGPAVGLTTCLTVDGGTLVGSIPTAERWQLRVDVPSAAGSSGRPSEASRPGRLHLASSGLEAQVAIGAAGLAELPSRPVTGGPLEVVVLPSTIDAETLPPSSVSIDSGRPVRQLVVGIDSDRLEPAALRVPRGDHIFVGGTTRTGMTTTLLRVAAAWRDCEPHGAVIRWEATGAELRARLDGLADREALVVVDDADRVRDRDGVLAEITAGERPHVTIAAAARLDAVRAAYGHWTREVARCRCGFVMTAPGEVDGDLLGVVLPRRSAVPHRPGLAWLIDGRGHRLVQVAGRMPS